jgi:hypothetical protein
MLPAVENSEPASSITVPDWIKLVGDLDLHQFFVVSFFSAYSR